MKRMMLMLFIVIMITGISGCSDESDKGNTNNVSTGEPQKGGVIRVGVLEEPGVLDSHRSAQAVVNETVGNIGASLVFKNPETGEYEPYLAKSWVFSEDGKTWTFNLKEGITFHNGEELTAENFVVTYERGKESTFTVGMFLAEVESIEAPEKYTLVLNLKQPFAPLLEYLSFPGWLQPFPLNVISEEKQFGRHPVGVGPWKFKDWKNGQSISLVSNEEFNWGPKYFKNQGVVYPDGIKYDFIPETQTRLAALESGSIDIAKDVPVYEIERFKSNEDYVVYEQMKSGLGLFIELNVDDLEIRKAINYGIDKDALVNTVLRGAGEVAYGPLPSTIFGYDEKVEEYGYHFNLEKAKETLENNGFMMGDDGIYEKDGERLELELMTVPDNVIWSQSAVLIQSMLKEVGIEVDVISLEKGELNERGAKHDFDLSLHSYVFADPDVLAMFLKSNQADGGLNWNSVDDKELDDLLDQGRSTIDLEERKEVYAKVQKNIVENAYWAPLFTEKQFIVAKKTIQDIYFNSMFEPIYQDSWVVQ